MAERAKTRSPRWLWWVAGATTALILLAAGAMAWYYLVGGTVWTDGRDIRMPADITNLRHVLWTAPRPAGEKVNTGRQEYEPCLSPDGEALYFVRGLPGEGADIFVSYRREAAWTEPAPLAAVNTDHDELGPRLTPDGRFLLFCSDRPGGQGQYDLWAVERTPDGWGEPFNLGPTVNSEYNDYNPAVTPDGKWLIFATNRRAAARRREKQPWRATIRQSGLGDYDLFIAERIEPGAPASQPTSQPATAPSAPVPLRFARARELEGVNTPAHEGACCVSPAGDFLYFASNRDGGLGGFDLYRCRLIDGQCGEVVNLGPELNTPANDMDPQIGMGGFLIYFSSDRSASRGGYDLFVAESREVYALRARRAAPQLSWAVWALLAALAVLIPLLLFLRAAGYRHLNLLTKCFVVSLLAHVLLTILMSLFFLTRPILHHVAEAAGLTTAVNLEVAQEVEMRMQIRQQITELPVTDLPVADPTLAELVRTRPEAIPRQTPEAPELNVPHAEIKPVPITVQPEAPRLVRPAPAERVSLPLPTVQSETPKVRLSAETPVAELEQQPKVIARAPMPARQPARTEVPSVAARQVTLVVAPARPNSESIAELQVAERPLTPDVEKVAPMATAAAPVALEVAVPQMPARRVAERPATAPAAPAVQTASTQVRTASPRSEASEAVLAVPTARKIGESLVVAAAFSRPPAPAPAGVAIDIAAATDSPEIKPPALAAGRVEAGAEPVPVATAVRPPRELQARPLVGVISRQRPQAIATAVGVTPTKLTAASLLRPAVASSGRPFATEVTVDRIAPDSFVTPLLVLAGPGRLASPDAYFQRSFEQRQKFIDAMGGSKESEAAVARALAYLARNQQPDGHWPFKPRGRNSGRRGKNRMAITGLAALCFLAADHTPAKPGPYRECIRKAMDYLIRQQGPNGDLRGGGDMYSQAIAALAVAEAAAMTGNPSYRAAAIKASRFIINAQNRKTGGWRYQPNDPGDTSVFGWQVMALHSVERLGVRIPSETRDLAFRWLDRVSRSRHRMLAGYQGHNATQAMTAEAAASRVFLGQQLTQEQMAEVCDYLKFPGQQDRMYYYWYYASLALMQMQNEAWRTWNAQVRDTLIRYQQRDGSWDERRSRRYGARGGRIYATALSTLTLEVYYRYLPMYGRKVTPGRR